MPGHNNNDNNGSMMAEISSKHRRDIAEISRSRRDRARRSSQSRRGAGQIRPTRAIHPRRVGSTGTSSGSGLVGLMIRVMG